MKFLNRDHFEFYKEYGKEYEAADKAYAMFFYVIGLSGDARRNIGCFRDSETGFVKPEGLHLEWMNECTGALIRLAYNLYFPDPVIPENVSDPFAAAYSFSVSSIMSKMNEWLPYVLEAIKYLYG